MHIPPCSVLRVGIVVPACLAPVLPATADHWTTATTLNEDSTSRAAAGLVDAKFEPFNSMPVHAFLAIWQDDGDWTWLIGEGTHMTLKGDGMTALEFFQEHRSLAAWNAKPTSVPWSCQAIKLALPDSADGLYTIQPSGSAEPFEVYCDMTRNGGGWTLLVTSASNGWSAAQTLSRNKASPSLTDNYSILDEADGMKDPAAANLMYRIEAKEFGSWGGVWSTPADYTFVSSTTSQTNIELVEKFDSWEYNGNGIEKLMPKIGAGNGRLTTDGVMGSGWWGTLISDAGYSPAPYMHPEMAAPGKIWYWMRSGDEADGDGDGQADYTPWATGDGKEDNFDSWDGWNSDIWSWQDGYRKYMVGGNAGDCGADPAKTRWGYS